MHYPCGENKGADQLRGYREASLFSHMQISGFLTLRLIFQLFFEAVIGSGISNDMALDDITLTDVACRSKLVSISKSCCEINKQDNSIKLSNTYITLFMSLNGNFATCFDIISCYWGKFYKMQMHIVFFIDGIKKLTN